MEYLDGCVWTMVPGVQTLRLVEVRYYQDSDVKATAKVTKCLSSGYTLTYSWFLFSEIQCRDPDAFEGVLFKVSTHSVGGVAHYSCPRGHSLQGNSSRVCLKNGAWDGKTPTCTRK